MEKINKMFSKIKNLSLIELLAKRDPCQLRVYLVIKYCKENDPHYDIIKTHYEQFDKLFNTKYLTLYDEALNCKDSVEREKVQKSIIDYHAECDLFSERLINAVYQACSFNIIKKS